MVFELGFHWPDFWQPHYLRRKFYEHYRQVAGSDQSVLEFLVLRGSVCLVLHFEIGGPCDLLMLLLDIRVLHGPDIVRKHRR